MGRKSRSKRTTGSRRRMVPPGACTDPEQIVKTYCEVDTNVRLLLADDLALGGPRYMALPDMTPAGRHTSGPMPVALFEPPKAIGMTLPDGSMQEMQAEAIIQSGFSRHRMVTALEHLTEWSVRQTTNGVELWDHGGIWARGETEVPGRWWDAANEWGIVMVMYGVQLGVDNYKTGEWTPADRAAALRNGRYAGIVASAIVTWRGLPIPDEVKFEQPSYDPSTGRFEFGVGPGGVPLHWRLHTPGEGVHHGLIVGEEGIGKTSALRLVMIEAMCSGRFAVWPADPSGRHDLSWAAGAVDLIAHNPAETVRMLRAAAEIIPARMKAGGCPDPLPDKPGILIAIDECEHVFAGNKEATSLGELIVTEGGPAGVALVATARGGSLAYFGGSARLRSALASGNCVGTDPATLEMINSTSE
jgi:hypothetical protein